MGVWSQDPSGWSKILKQTPYYSDGTERGNVVYPKKISLNEGEEDTNPKVFKNLM